MTFESTPGVLVLVFSLCISVSLVWICIGIICCHEHRHERRRAFRWREHATACTAELQAILEMPLSGCSVELRRFVDKMADAIAQLQTQAAHGVPPSLVFDLESVIETLQTQRSQAQNLLAAISCIDPAVLSLLDQAYAEAHSNALEVIEGLQVEEFGGMAV